MLIWGLEHDPLSLYRRLQIKCSRVCARVRELDAASLIIIDLEGVFMVALREILLTSKKQKQKKTTTT